jgi:hypothetical protein
MNYITNTFENKFYIWQQNIIFTKKYSDITINQCIFHLINEGILPFLSNNGYTIIRSKNDFMNGIATILFNLYINKFYLAKLPFDYFNDEFYNYYNFYTDWDTFWKVWNGNLNDFLQFDNTSYCYQLQDYIYSSLDFEKSYKYKEYIEANQDLDDDDYNKKKKEDIDPYLLENYHHKFVKFDL